MPGAQEGGVAPDRWTEAMLVFVLRALGRVSSRNEGKEGLQVVCEPRLRNEQGEEGEGYGVLLLERT